MRIRSAILSAVLLLLACVSLPLYAQNATVSGQVLDPQQAALVGASVTLTRASTQVSVHTVTGPDGTFILPPVVPGHYDARVTADGFSPAVITDITLEIGESKVLNVALKVSTAQGSKGATTDVSMTSSTFGEEATLSQTNTARQVQLSVRFTF